MTNFLTENPKIAFAVSSIVLIVIIYSIYRKYQSILKHQQLEPIFIRKPTNAKKPYIKSNLLVPLPRNGTGYSMTIWMWIDDWDYRYGEWKHVLHKGDPDATKVQPGIWLHPTKNSLYIKFDREDRQPAYNDIIKDKIYPSIVGRNSRHSIDNVSLKKAKSWCENKKDCQGFSIIYKQLDDTPTAFASYPDVDDEGPLIEEDSSVKLRMKNAGYLSGTFIKGTGYNSMNPSVNKDMITDTTMSNTIENVPLGRWFHVAIIVKEQTTDVYIDGNLRNSTPIESAAKHNNGPLYITQGGGFSGIMNQLRYYDTSLSHDKITEIYSWGPDPFMWPNLNAYAEKLKAKMDINVSFNVSANVNGKGVSTGTNLNANIDGTNISAGGGINTKIN